MLEEAPLGLRFMCFVDLFLRFVMLFNLHLMRLFDEITQLLLAICNRAQNLPLVRRESNS